MKTTLNRRHFLQQSLCATSVGAAALSFEERALLARQPDPAGRQPSTSVAGLPSAKIGNVSITRLICGGNLISGFAHSRDLIYVSSLLKHYFTDEKVFETLELCEEQGINTAILRLDDHTVRILRRYRRERGGQIQWLAQVKIKDNDLTSEAQRAVDEGAVGAYVHGGVGDDFVSRGRVDALGEAVEFIKSKRVIGGVAGHSLEVPVACEKAGVNPDFYMKTFNSQRYWSAGLMPRHDSVWSETPEATAAFMRQLKKPWIAYKVLGAGAIHPREGFGYAFDNGADCICVGMFDFQVIEDAELARRAVATARQRERPWCA